MLINNHTCPVHFYPSPKSISTVWPRIDFMRFIHFFIMGSCPSNPPPLLSISLHSKTCTHSKYANKQDINSQPGLEALESRGHQAESGAKRAEWRGHRIMQIILEFQAYFSILDNKNLFIFFHFWTMYMNYKKKDLKNTILKSV